MKRAVFIFLAVLSALLVSGCLLLEQPLALKQITVDGTLTEWGDYLKEDHSFDATDSAWEVQNELYKAGVAVVKDALYIAGIYTKSGNNNFLVLVDFGNYQGATDTSQLPWSRNYKFKNGQIDFHWESWEDGFKCWKFLPTGEATELTNAEATFTTWEGKIIVEAKIPLSNFGITDATKAYLKAAFGITGGRDENGKQWIGDVYPNGQAVAPSDNTGAYEFDKFVELK